MGARSTAESYGKVAQGLHWVTALLILGLIPLGLIMTRLEEGSAQTGLYRAHVALGLMVAILTLVRVVWRIVEPTPEPPPMPHWRHRLFIGIHVALYGGLVVLAFTGIATLLGSDMAPFPSEVIAADIDRDLAPRAGHQVLAYIFIALFIAHVAGAVSYQLKKGDVLGKMGINLAGRTRRAG